MAGRISGSDELDIPFPEEKFAAYLKQLGVSSRSSLRWRWYQGSLQRIMLLAISDFKGGALSLDGLSSIGGYLLGCMDEKARSTTELGDVLDDASELSFYSRVAQDPECADTLIYFLQKVLDYFEKHAP